MFWIKFLGIVLVGIVTAVTTVIRVCQYIYAPEMTEMELFKLFKEVYLVSLLFLWVGFKLIFIDEEKKSGNK